MVTDASQLKKIAEGREAEMFAWEDGRVLRLYREGWGLDAVRQAQLLELAQACGLRVPATYGVVDVGGRKGIVMERIAGPDLLLELNARPWRLLQVAGAWGQLQAEINSKQAPLDVEPTRIRLRRMIEQSPLIKDDLRGPALEKLDSAPDGDRLLHGDFHPANIMRNDDDLVVIDWTNATRGPAEADFYRSYLMGTMGDLPPGSPWLIRTFARFGRRILRGGFVRSYRRVLRPDPAVVDAWKLPIIVARIAEGIEPEFPTLERMALRLINDKSAH
jgi:hypothetical protein